ncbi:flocculation-associated PEP-CTERM protein PepA [Ningiella sp. W23]|uniref:flocculation-associated PEP-CTERM protein PepA n=1 Tax=Ningiella sp. W23 TaxID=3023715 RepID=UPI0037579E45
MLNTFKKVALAGAFLTMSAASSAAGLPFTIDNSLGYTDGGTSTTFTANIMSGNYQEVIVVTDAAAGLFEATILLSYTSFQTFPNNTGLTTDYGLYSMINISGQVTDNSLPTSITTGNWTGDFNMVLDVETDTNTFVPSALAGIGMANLSAAELDDDIELFTGTIAGGGSVGNLNAGGFGLDGNNITLSADGLNFFVAPNPFYQLLISDGDLEDFFSQVDFSLEGVVQRFSGEASVEFVSSPSVVALLGLALAGIGFRARSKK